VPTSIFLGEFEQFVLLSILHLDNDADVLSLRRQLEAAAGRSISRGALYRTLDRLEEKGWARWTLDEAEQPERGGHPRRRFAVTSRGRAVLRASRETLLGLWNGVEAWL